MIERDRERFRLTIPTNNALAFAMGWADLHYVEPEDELRHLVGLLAIDALEYAEQWRAAGMARLCLTRRWPEFAF